MQAPIKLAVSILQTSLLQTQIHRTSPSVLGVWLLSVAGGAGVAVIGLLRHPLSVVIRPLRALRVRICTLSVLGVSRSVLGARASQGHVPKLLVHIACTASRSEALKISARQASKWPEQVPFHRRGTKHPGVNEHSFQQ